jgi:hypothetical protein
MNGDGDGDSNGDGNHKHKPVFHALPHDHGRDIGTGKYGRGVFPVIFV